MTNSLEFYKKAALLRDEFQKRQNIHMNVLKYLVEVYFENNDSFPDTLFIEYFKHHKISTTKEILITLGFFNDERRIENYNFVKDVVKVHLFGNHYYNNYTLTISPKKEKE